MIVKPTAADFYRWNPLDRIGLKKYSFDERVSGLDVYRVAAVEDSKLKLVATNETAKTIDVKDAVALENAEEYLDRLAKDPKWTLQTHLLRGLVRLEAAEKTKRYDRAVVEFEAAAKIEPKNILVYMCLSRADRLAGDFVKAIAAVDKAIELDPKNPAALSERADLLYSAGEVKLRLDRS